jgi:hypothetical protein
LREIADDFPGKTLKAELERILYALMVYPLTAHELREFLGCEQPEKSIKRFTELVGYMATGHFSVTDENGNEHLMNAYTLRPDRGIGWEIFGRYMEPAQLSRALLDVKNKAMAVKAAQHAKGEGKA